MFSEFFMTHENGKTLAVGKEVTSGDPMTHLGPPGENYEQQQGSRN
jgi:hypothetical protein